MMPASLTPGTKVRYIGTRWPRLNGREGVVIDSPLSPGGTELCVRLDRKDTCVETIWVMPEHVESYSRED